MDQEKDVACGMESADHRVDRFARTLHDADIAADLAYSSLTPGCGGQNVGWDSLTDVDRTRYVLRAQYILARYNVSRLLGESMSKSLPDIDAMSASQLLDILAEEEGEDKIERYVSAHAADMRRRNAVQSGARAFGRIR